MLPLGIDLTQILATVMMKLSAPSKLLDQWGRKASMYFYFVNIHQNNGFLNQPLNEALLIILPNRLIEF